MPKEIKPLQNITDGSFRWLDRYYVARTTFGKDCCKESKTLARWNLETNFGGSGTKQPILKRDKTAGF